MPPTSASPSPANVIEARPPPGRPPGVDGAGAEEEVHRVKLGLRDWNLDVSRDKAGR